MVDHPGFTWTRTSTSLDRRLVIGVLAVVVLIAALGGYLIGTNRSGVVIHTGKAYSTQGQISLTGEDGWSYSAPVDVHWTDASGVLHQGDRPFCLPPVGEVAAPVTFATTQVTVKGMTWRPVVWVSCGN
jgi:hypothetical protein